MNSLRAKLKSFSILGYISEALDSSVSLGFFGEVFPAIDTEDSVEFPLPTVC